MVTITVPLANEAQLLKFSPNVKIDLKNEKEITFTMTDFAFKMFYQTVKANGIDPMQFMQWANTKSTRHISDDRIK